jgi:hypothetical protein
MTAWRDVADDVAMNVLPRMTAAGLRAVAWGDGNGPADAVTRLTKTHLLVGAQGRATLCGTVIPDGRRVRKADIRVRPCKRCLRAAGKSAAVSLTATRRCARELHENMASLGR